MVLYRTNATFDICLYRAFGIILATSERFKEPLSQGHQTRTGRQFTDGIHPIARFESLIPLYQTPRAHTTKVKFRVHLAPRVLPESNVLLSIGRGLTGLWTGSDPEARRPADKFGWLL
jgi:hypothetical protein